MPEKDVPPGAPLIVLEGVRRDFPSGEGVVTVLRDVDLTIHAGEKVAIVGASGSGKSTLMNILGCLDRPSAGRYRIAGRDVSDLGADELAAQRRERFGFIFQRYLLLGELTALGNTEIPAVYAGRPRGDRAARAASLLGRLGMEGRLEHRPGQLSGGQQQRVSIARALMNDAEIILADEPTGALDSVSGKEVLRILDELNAEGRTVIIVTHDMAIAERADRIIEISDGRIVADRRGAGAGKAPPAEARAPAPALRRHGGSGAFVSRFREAFRMALVALAAHRLRSFLTMLGIIIGIASVVSVVAVGAGSQQQVLASISNLGTNTLEIYPGTGFGDMRSGRVTTLVVSDAQALARQPYAAAVAPTVQTSATLRYGATEASAQITGTSEQFFSVAGLSLVSGQFFDAASVAGMAQQVVIDTNTRDTLFPGMDPVGQTLLANRVPLSVIGVVNARQGGPGGSGSLAVYTPYTTVQARLVGSTALRSITLRVDDDTEMAVAEAAVNTLLTQRHGVTDFFIVNTDDIRQTITSTTETMTLLIASIAVISLVVGGIGVMNIMLVSVSERVSEIGVRMAVGARRADIMQQFLIEAVLVCLIGGVIGIVMALGVGQVFTVLEAGFTFIYSGTSIVVAFLCSSLIGIAFGFLPARSAARLDPVQALSKG